MHPRIKRDVQKNQPANYFIVLWECIQKCIQVVCIHYNVEYSSSITICTHYEELAMAFRQNCAIWYCWETALFLP